MRSTFESYFENLRSKRIAVLGLGVSNRPLVRLLLEFGCQVLGCDKTPREQLDEEVLELEKMGCKLHVGEGYLDGVEADVVFRTPGMHPANPSIESLRARGALRAGHGRWGGPPQLFKRFWRCKRTICYPISSQRSSES